MANEADTCRKYVLPRLYKSGWTDDQINEQRYFTDGRIVTLGKGHYRKPGKKVDYLLRFRPHYPLAVVEAKADYKKASDGLQQAMDYAETLGLKFAYSTNGHGIIEHDYTTGSDGGGMACLLQRPQHKLQPGCDVVHAHQVELRARRKRDRGQGTQRDHWHSIAGARRNQ
jgi:type I site-specific restriction endonuclease